MPHKFLALTLGNLRLGHQRAKRRPKGMKIRLQPSFVYDRDTSRREVLLDGFPPGQFPP